MDQSLEILKVLDELEWDIFSGESLALHLQTSNKAIQNNLENLVSRGLLSRIEKGKYCRHTFRDEYVISNYLAEDGVVAYWSALNLHGLTEQFPNTVFVQTAKLKRNKSVFGVRYQFVKVKPEKMTGVEIQGYGNHQYRMTDIEKTLADCFDLPEYSGGFTELLRAFARAEIRAEKLIRYCQAIDNISAAKRMAYLAELLQKPDSEPFLEYAQRVVNKKYTLFDGLGSEKGEFINRWKLRLNVSREDILLMCNKPY
jgi:predicted transcriptional regulator of viral defense system